MNILILQLKRIGDLILTTPVVSCLREEFPQARITIACMGHADSLLPALDADQFAVFRGRSGGRGFWKAFFGTRHEVCLDFTGNDRSTFLAALSRAPLRATYLRFRKRPLRAHVFNRFVDSPVQKRHTADYHTDLLQVLDIQRENIPLRLTPPQAALSRAREILAASAVNRPFAALHPGTLRPEKYWQAELWAEVADHLHRRHGLDVVMTGTNDPVEEAHRQLIHHTASHPLTDLSGQLSLVELAALIGEARILCGVDSAPVHMADALGTPVAALFGPTDPLVWRPRKFPQGVVTPPDGKMGAMKTIGAAEVLNATDRLLQP